MYPLLDPRTGRTCTERVPPCVIWWFGEHQIGDPEPPYPFGKPLTRP
jgi:hypothetical protein